MDFIYFRFAQIQISRENWTAARKAIAAYQETPSGNRDLTSALLLADVERRQGNFKASAQQYEAIFKQADSLAIKESALLGLSGVLQSLEQWEKALIAYERLIHLKPQSDRAQIGSAYLSLKLQQMTPSQAESVLATWLANYPTIPTAMVPPELLNLVGELPAAVSRLGLYETLLAIAPDHLDLNRRYAQTLAMTDPEAAMIYLEAIAPDDPSDINFYFVQGEVAQTLDELDLASQAYETILVQEPNNVAALSALAQVRLQQWRLEEAELLYEEVLAFRPNDLKTLRVLAELRLAQNEAIAAFEDYEAHYPLATAPTIKHCLHAIRLDFLHRHGLPLDWEQD